MGVLLKRSSKGGLCGGSEQGAVLSQFAIRAIESEKYLFSTCLKTDAFTTIFGGSNRSTSVAEQAQQHASDAHGRCVVRVLA